MTKQGEIFINRTWHFLGLSGPAIIFINNEKKGTVEACGELSMQLKPGNYTIQTKLAGYKSNIINFKIKEDESINFNIYIDLPYWKQALVLFYAFFDGGISRIEIVSPRKLEL